MRVRGRGEGADRPAGRRRGCPIDEGERGAWQGEAFHEARCTDRLSRAHLGVRTATYGGGANVARQGDVARGIRVPA
jgi:hypothetical protein